MNDHLQILPVAENAVRKEALRYAESLVRQADLAARSRAGTAIDLPDVEQSVQHLTYKDRTPQILCLLSGTFLASGVGGLAQNLLDQKSGWPIYAVFGLLTALGAWCAYRAFRST